MNDRVNIYIYIYITFESSVVNKAKLAGVIVMF